MGQLHARILAQSRSAELAAVVDRNSGQAARVAVTLGTRAVPLAELADDASVKWPVVAQRMSGNLHREVAHCLDAVDADSDFVNPLSDAVDAVAVADGINCSLWSGRPYDVSRFRRALTTSPPDQRPQPRGRRAMSEQGHLAVVGYADPFVARQGDQVAFMVSCEDRTYTATIVRLLHGDTNPDGPGRLRHLPPLHHLRQVAAAARRR